MSRRWSGESSVEERVTEALLAEQIDSVLDTLSERQARVVVAHTALGIPAGAIAERMGLSADQVRKINRRALGQLRHFSRSEVLAGFLAVRGASRQMREIAAEYGVDVSVPCGYERCRGWFVPEVTVRGGRPRRYCSGACRSAAYRARRC